MGRTYDPKLVETTIETIPMLSVDAVDFCASASNTDLQEQFGFMPDQVVSRIRAWLG